MHFEIFVDLFHQYRWRLVNEHSSEIAISADGYYSKAVCERYIELVRGATTAEARDLTNEMARK